VTQGLLFIAWAGVFLLLATMAIVRLAVLRVESPLGRRSDGLPPGSRAPHWSLIDSAGRMRGVPHGDGPQVLLFTDHAIVEFANLADGFARLRQEAGDLDVVMISRSDTEVTAAACSAIGLDIEHVVVDDHFYRRHNVWVVPHITFLDGHGRVLVTGNVAEPAGLLNMWRHARLLAAGESPRSPQASGAAR
jgi:hypothetical protein